MTATGYAETLDLSELGNCVVNESFKNFILRFLISPYTAFISNILQVFLGFHHSQFSQCVFIQKKIVKPDVVYPILINPRFCR